MSKKIRWLNSTEAESLGFKAKPNEKGRKNARYSLSKNDWSTIQDYRGSAEELSVIGKSTMRNAKGEVILEWTKTNKSQDDVLRALRAAVDTLKESVKPVKSVDINRLSFRYDVLGRRNWL